MLSSRMLPVHIDKVRNCSGRFRVLDRETARLLPQLCQVLLSRQRGCASPQLVKTPLGKKIKVPYIQYFTLPLDPSPRWFSTTLTLWSKRPMNQTLVSMACASSPARIAIQLIETRPGIEVSSPNDSCQAGGIVKLHLASTS